MINAGSVVAFMELDTAKFSKGLNLAGEQLKSAAGNFKNVFSGGNDLSERFSQAGLGMKNLGNSITSVGSSITQNVSMPLAAAGIAASKLASDFETGMAKIKTIADTSKVSLAELGDSVKKISMDTGQATGDVQDAMYDALSSGVQTDKVSKFVSTASKAAIGGFTTTQVAVDGLTTTLNAYGKTAEEADKIANQMMITQNLGKTTFGELSSSIGNVVPTAAAAGMSTEELFSSLGVLTATGIKTSESVTGVKAALSNIIKPSKEASDAADALGLNFNVAEMKAKGWMGFLDEVREKLEQSAPAYAAATDKVNDLESKIKAAQEGKKNNAEKYKAEIEEQNKAIDALQKQKDKASNSAEKKQIEAEIKAHKDKIKTLREEAEQAKKGYSPEQVAVWKKELTGAKKEQELLGKSSQDTLMGYANMFGSVEALNSVLALTSKNGKELYKTSMQQMASGKDYVQDAYDTMSNTPEMKMKKAMASLKVAGIEMGEAFLPYIGKLADGITTIVKAFEKLPTPVKNAIGQAVAFGAVLGPIIMIAGKVVSSTKLIFDAFSLLSKAPKLLSGLSKIPSMLSWVTKIPSMLSVFTKIPSLLGVGVKAFTALPALLTSPIGIAVAIIGGLGLIVYEIFKHWDKVGPYFAAAGAKIGEVFNLFLEGWKYIFSCIGDIFSKSIEGWKLLGSHLLDGLLSGLEKGKDKIFGFFSKLGKGIKDLFAGDMEIHSPSRVFMRYGQYIGEGLINGMNSMQNPISKQTEKYSQLMKPKIPEIVMPKAPVIPKIAAEGNIGPSQTMLGKLKSAMLNFNPQIHIYVTVADTDEKGTKKLTNEVKGMVQTSLKDGLVSMFMDDAVRD
jgi:TP901 family phage tail tape measure protein